MGEFSLTHTMIFLENFPTCYKNFPLSISFSFTISLLPIGTIKRYDKREKTKMVSIKAKSFFMIICYICWRKKLEKKLFSINIIRFFFLLLKRTMMIFFMNFREVGHFFVLYFSMFLYICDIFLYRILFSSLFS